MAPLWRLPLYGSEEGLEAGEEALFAFAALQAFEQGRWPLARPGARSIFFTYKIRKTAKKTMYYFVKCNGRSEWQAETGDNDGKIRLSNWPGVSPL